MQPIRIGIVGVGKIARDSHIPSIRANSDFELTAAASPDARESATHVPEAARFTTIESMLDGIPGLAAVAICTPPQARYDAARLALERGKHVLLEKPPCPSVARLGHLIDLAASAGMTLYQSWHSQHAPAVALAEQELRHRTLRHIRVTWKEDAREWHPGQQWLWEAGGFGVFDPGINALSILTRLIPGPLFARSALLRVPDNCATPVAAELALETASGIPIEAVLDFRYHGTPQWEIELMTDSGPMRLAGGGARLTLGDEPAQLPKVSLGSEYAGIYRRFAELISRGQSEVDCRPLVCVADLYLVARYVTVEPFELG